jgi:hypothetical protein
VGESLVVSGFLWAIALFILSFVASTLIIRLGVGRLTSDSAGGGVLPESKSRHPFDFRSTGFWIGFCETLLTFVLVYHTQFAALAVIVGAKEFVRRDEIQKVPSYYLLGTLVNLSSAVLFALFAKSLSSP